jgi:hypothetical protein
VLSDASEPVYLTSAHPSIRQPEGRATRRGKRQREADGEHRCQADDLGARLEIAEGGAFCHSGRLEERPVMRQQSSSDNTPMGAVKDLVGKCGRGLTGATWVGLMHS